MHSSGSIAAFAALCLCASVLPSKAVPRWQGNAGVDCDERYLVVCNGGLDRPNVRRYGDESDGRGRAPDRRGRATLARVVAPLALKVRDIQSQCRAWVVSAVRHTRVAGTRRLSLHAHGKAVDVAGDYRCIYAQLRDWPGGYSVDATRVRHIHISYDVQNHAEWGARFVHGGRHRAGRFAARQRQVASR